MSTASKNMRVIVVLQWTDTYSWVITSEGHKLTLLSNIDDSKSEPMRLFQWNLAVPHMYKVICIELLNKFHSESLESAEAVTVALIQIHNEFVRVNTEREEIYG